MDESLGKTVIACLIVRLKSTRLPRKALVDVGGRPLTARLISRLKTAHSLSRIVLCTSTNSQDAPLLDLARQCEIDAYAGSEEDVLSRIIDVAEQYKADVLLRVTGDNIYTDPETIDRMVYHHIQTDADYTRTNGLPWGVTAEVLSARMLRPLHAMIDPTKTEYLTIYACDPKRFHCEFLDSPKDIRRPNYSLTVDTPEDLSLVRMLFEKLPGSEAGPSLRDIIAALDAIPDYKGIPDSAPIKLPDGKSITYREMLDWLQGQARISRAPGTAPRE